MWLCHVLYRCYDTNYKGNNSTSTTLGDSNFIEVADVIH